ncbi:MAG: hypothetical protein AAGH72_11415 [Verrucomicrobiota bacterium]
MKTNHSLNNQDHYLAQEAIAMMENGRPTPVHHKRRLIEGLTRDFTATYIHFGTTGNPLKPGTAR